MKIFGFLVRLSPYLRFALIRWVYDKYASHNYSEKNIFLNYGYHDDTHLSLHEQDEPNRLFIQLYHRTVQNLDLQNKDIVEVGSGQGAGGIFLSEYHNPRSYRGIDLSKKAIAFCQRHNQNPHIEWKQGSADQLPIPNESADVVINIESSHLYPSMDRFIGEVRRILRPHGYMAFADLRPHSQVGALEKCFRDSGFRIITRSDITPQVLASLTLISDRRKAHITATYPKILRQAAQEMSAVKGTPIYNSFINSQQKYLCYLLQKQSSTGNEYAYQQP